MVFYSHEGQNIKTEEYYWMLKIGIDDCNGHTHAIRKLTGWRNLVAALVFLLWTQILWNLPRIYFKDHTKEVWNIGRKNNKQYNGLLHINIVIHKEDHLFF